MDKNIRENKKLSYLIIILIGIALILLLGRYFHLDTFFINTFIKSKEQQAQKVLVSTAKEVLTPEEVSQKKAILNEFKTQNTQIKLTPEQVAEKKRIIETTLAE